MAHKTVIVGCRIAPATRRLLQAIAARENRTLSKTVAAVLEEAARGRVAELGSAGGGRGSHRTARP